MKGLRAFYRLLGLLGVQVAFATLAFVLFQKYKNDRITGMKRAVHYTGVWGRACCRWFNFKVRVRGSRPPEAAAMVVANHVGSPDIFALAAALPGFFVAKQEVRHWPLVGRMADIGGTVYIDRSKRQSAGFLLDNLEERLAAGYRVMVFPEGGATDGLSIHPFKSPPFEAAIRTGYPVLPVLIEYHDGQHPSLACWNHTSFPTHLWRLLTCHELQITLHLLPPLSGYQKRRDLCRDAREILQAEHGRRMKRGEGRQEDFN